MADYEFVHDGHVYTPDQSAVTPADNDARNKRIELAQLTDWATVPAVFSPAYYQFADDIKADNLRFHTTRTLQDCCVTTWLGTRLGTITKANVYTNNLGARLVSLRVQGTNGAEYYGRASWDWGTVITLRKARG